MSMLALWKQENALKVSPFDERFDGGFIVVVVQLNIALCLHKVAVALDNALVDRCSCFVVL